MPCSSITYKQNIIILILLWELFQKEIHAFSIASRHYPEAAVSSFRFYCSVDISVFSNMVAWNSWPRSLSAPARFRFADPAQTRFVLKQNSYSFWWSLFYKFIVSGLTRFYDRILFVLPMSYAIGNCTKMLAASKEQVWIVKLPRSGSGCFLYARRIISCAWNG